MDPNPKSMVFIIGTPKMVALIFGNTHIEWALLYTGAKFRNTAGAPQGE